MRLDKYLKVSRLVKRREVANELISQGYVTINNSTTKPSKEVKIGDIIMISTLKRILTVKVVEIRNSATVEDATKMYEILKEEKTDEARI